MARSTVYRSVSAKRRTSVPRRSSAGSAGLSTSFGRMLAKLAVQPAPGEDARQVRMHEPRQEAELAREERALVARPASGAWRMTVKNTLGLAGTAQEFTGVLETAHAEYATLNDISTLNAQQREDGRRQQQNRGPGLGAQEGPRGPAQLAPLG